MYSSTIAAPMCYRKVDDLEGKVEREESLGISKITDLSRSHILDLYTCTECGRCSDNCPAFITDKKLSPKHITLALRDNLYASEKNMFGKQDGIEPHPHNSVVADAHKPLKVSGGEVEAIHTSPPAPKARISCAMKSSILYPT